MSAVGTCNIFCKKNVPLTSTGSLAMSGFVMHGSLSCQYERKKYNLNVCQGSSERRAGHCEACPSSLSALLLHLLQPHSFSGRVRLLGVVLLGCRLLHVWCSSPGNVNVNDSVRNTLARGCQGVIIMSQECQTLTYILILLSRLAGHRGCWKYLIKGGGAVLCFC